jgi:hypothetical protein
MFNLFDKVPIQSKKFWAYLISEFGWKVCLFYCLYNYRSKVDIYNLILMGSIIIVSAFIQIGYILGQVALDKYIKVAEVARGDDDDDVPMTTEDKPVSEKKK